MYFFNGDFDLSVDASTIVCVRSAEIKNDFM